MALLITVYLIGALTTSCAAMVRGTPDCSFLYGCNEESHMVEMSSAPWSLLQSHSGTANCSRNQTETLRHQKPFLSWHMPMLQTQDFVRKTKKYSTFTWPDSTKKEFSKAFQRMLAPKFFIRLLDYFRAIFLLWVHFFAFRADQLATSWTHLVPGLKKQVALVWLKNKNERKRYCNSFFTIFRISDREVFLQWIAGNLSNKFVSE